MPNQQKLTSRVSARSVYSRNATLPEVKQPVATRTRNRPRNSSSPSHSAPPVSLKKDNSTGKNQKLVTKKEFEDHSSSEADRSSEGEDDDNEEVEDEEEDEISSEEEQEDEESTNDEEEDEEDLSEEDSLDDDEDVRYSLAKPENQSQKRKKATETSKSKKISNPLPKNTKKKVENGIGKNQKEKTSAENNASPIKQNKRLTKRKNEPSKRQRIESSSEDLAKNTNNNQKHVASNNNIKKESPKKKPKQNNRNDRRQFPTREAAVSDHDEFHTVNIRGAVETSVVSADQNFENVPPTRTSYEYFNISPLFPCNGTKIKYPCQGNANRYIPCGNIAADEAFRWLIYPMKPEVFFSSIFEQRPHHILRNFSMYYHGLFNGNDLQTMLKEHMLEYDTHLDCLKYVDGERVKVNVTGRAYYSNIWEDYTHGYSVRVRNPQSYNKNLWNMCSLLQEYFGSTAGVNMYLTPPNSQGFPPHYDDIDAFICQVEGSKIWKIYAPRDKNEDLARYSSRDFNQDEIGTPCKQVCLMAGEMLYIPRGYIHQAETKGMDHSLHLTFSTNQLNTWGELLAQATSAALDSAILNEVELRKSLPKDYMNFVGSSHANNPTPSRKSFDKHLKDLGRKVLSYLDADAAADSHSLRFIRSSLPPVFSKIERDRSIHGNGNRWKNGMVRLKNPFTAETKIQLLRRRNLRLVIDEQNGPRLFHNLENSRDKRPDFGEVTGEDGQGGVYVELDYEALPAFHLLFERYPEFVKVDDLPFAELVDKIDFSTALYENGVLMTEDPLALQDESIMIKEENVMD